MSWTQTIIVALALAALIGTESAQSRTFYDSAGRVVGRSSTDSQGTSPLRCERQGHQPRDAERQHHHDLRCRWPGDRSRDDDPLALGLRRLQVVRPSCNIVITAPVSAAMGLTNIQPDLPKVQ
jgi:hypothetical protein